jgi:hypothetical protein
MVASACAIDGTERYLRRPTRNNVGLRFVENWARSVPVALNSMACGKLVPQAKGLPWTLRQRYKAAPSWVLLSVMRRQ